MQEYKNVVTRCQLHLEWNMEKNETLHKSSSTLWDEEERNVTEL